MLNVNSKTNLMFRKYIEDSAFWYLELAEKGALRLKNCKFSEYLCTDRFLFHDKIFTSEENEETKSLFLISDFENRSNGSNGLLSKLNRQDKLFN